jgi:hypothetical protein
MPPRAERVGAPLEASGAPPSPKQRIGAQTVLRDAQTVVDPQAAFSMARTCETQALAGRLDIEHLVNRSCLGARSPGSLTRS